MRFPFTLKEIFHIIVIPLGLFIFHLFTLYGVYVYNFWPWFDAPMHFAGGLCMGIASQRILQISHRKGLLVVKNGWLRLLIVCGVVALAAVIWEAGEFLGDIFINHKPYFQPSTADTMGDLALGVFGGLVSLASMIFAKKDAQ